MVKPLIPCALMLFVLCATGLHAGTDAVSDLALFSRCYAHLSQRKLPFKHPLRAKVLRGELSAVDACLTLLDEAKLSAAGDNEGKLLRDSLEAKAVLRTMNDHHRNWFPNDDLVISSPQCAERCPLSDSLHDGTEAALHLTRALLTPNVKFSEIVTGDSAMEALRSGGPKSNLSQTQNKIFIGNSVTSGTDNAPVPLQVELVQFGELLGMRKLSLNPQKQNALAKSNTGWSRPDPFYIHRSLGGGIIGTKSYLLLNLGRPDVSFMNGGLAMPRRWAKTVLSDLLCRELPVIRVADALPYVQKKVTVQTPPFRQGASCMQCHATMDPMSASIRNVVYTYVPGVFETSIEDPKKASSHIYSYPADKPQEVDPVDADPDFYRRPANGRLFFRNYKGELINRQVLGLGGEEGLGRLLAETEDLYLCAAARYFEYFTGIHVQLEDPGATPNTTDASPNPHRESVVKFGLELKKHQSLRELIRQILQSETYRSRSFERLALKK